MLPAWPAITVVDRPGEGDAVVIAISLQPSAERLAELRALLSPDELAKADRFAFPELRVRSAAARGQLREILAAALGADPRSLAFKYGLQGKPSLREAPSALHFNVSHSGDVGLVSLALREHGVDVEVHRSVHHDEVGQRFFAPPEVARLIAAPPERRVEAFFGTWTAKEAFLKATGEGITVPLADFVAVWEAPGAGHIDVLRGGAAGRSFWLRALDAGPGVSAAICGEGPPPSIRLAAWRR